MAPKILVVGSANMDLITCIDVLPSAGTTVISEDDYGMIPGGKGGNTAVAAARAGGDTVFCVRVGNDAYGVQLTEIYKTESISVWPKEAVLDARTGLASIIVESSTGNNRIVVYPGANRYLVKSDVEEVFLTNPEIMLIQLEISHETVIDSVKLSNKNGVPVILDAGPADKNFPLEKLGRLEVFSPNESETFTFTGIVPSTDDNIRKACMALYDRLNAKYIVLKLGDRGCCVYDGLHHTIIPSYKINAVDTTAAGDTFTAALAIEYLRLCGNIIGACRYANAAGALSATRSGAYTSIPNDEEIREFMEKRNS